MKGFEYWKKLHDGDKLEDFNSDKEGLLWLKIKSIKRKDLLPVFVKEINVQSTETSLDKQFVKIFHILSKDVANSHKLLDAFIRRINAEQSGKLNTEQFVSELYKLKKFDWGGDYQNSLDKYLVSRYVKTFQSYEMLHSKFDTEIRPAVQGYVLNSWYNHWSSILIEHIFKSHPTVLPTIGQIKNEDFNNSWKLKRNLDLLKPAIQNHLDNFGNNKSRNLKVTFEYKGKSQTFNALADVIFVVK